MDDLEFRRTIYADPHNDSDTVKRAALDDQAKQQFQKELQQLDQQLQQASKVKVPDGMAHRILLNHAMGKHQKRKERTLQWSLAASVLVVALLVGQLVLNSPSPALPDLSEHALAHVYMEGEHALGADEDVTLQQVNAKLASMGANLSQPVGHIYYANFCEFQNVRSLHLVMQGPEGKVTVFIIPHAKDKPAQVSPRLSDDKLIARGVRLQKADLVVVSEKDQGLGQFEQSLQKRLQFAI